MEESTFEIKDFGDKPFLRLTGGKQNVLNILIKHLPKDWEELRYIEPFFGADF